MNAIHQPGLTDDAVKTEETQPDEKAKRKGINWGLVARRVIIGTLLTLTGAGLLYLDFVFRSATFFIIIVALLMPAALYEFYSFLKEKKFTPLKYLGVITVAALILWEYAVNNRMFFGKEQYFQISLLQ